MSNSSGLPNSSPEPGGLGRRAHFQSGQTMPMTGATFTIPDWAQVYDAGRLTRIILNLDRILAESVAPALDRRFKTRGEAAQLIQRINWTFNRFTTGRAAYWLDSGDISIEFGMVNEAYYGGGAAHDQLIGALTHELEHVLQVETEVLPRPGDQPAIDKAVRRYKATPWAEVPFEYGAELASIRQRLKSGETKRQIMDSVDNDDAGKRAMYEVLLDMVGDVDPQTVVGRQDAGHPVTADDAEYRAYHGTSAPFSFLDTERGELGTHFGSPEHANAFAKDRPRARVIPADVQLNNPLRLRDQGDFSPGTVAAQLVDLGIMDMETLNGVLDVAVLSRKDANQIVQSAIVNAGYDGIIYLNRREGLPDTSEHDIVEKYGHDWIIDATDEEFLSAYPDARDSYIVFNPEQVKSPFGTKIAAQDEVTADQIRVVNLPEPVDPMRPRAGEFMPAMVRWGDGRLYLAKVPGGSEIHIKRVDDQGQATFSCSRMVSVGPLPGGTIGRTAYNFTADVRTILADTRPKGSFMDPLVTDPAMEPSEDSREFAPGGSPARRQWEKEQPVGNAPGHRPDDPTNPQVGDVYYFRMDNQPGRPWRDYHVVRREDDGSAVFSSIPARRNQAQAEHFTLSAADLTNGMDSGSIRVELPQSPTEVKSVDPTAEFDRLIELRDAGEITPEQFQDKSRRLFGIRRRAAGERRAENPVAGGQYTILDKLWVWPYGYSTNGFWIPEGTGLTVREVTGDTDIDTVRFDLDEVFTTYDNSRNPYKMKDNLVTMASSLRDVLNVTTIPASRPSGTSDYGVEDVPTMNRRDRELALDRLLDQLSAEQEPGRRRQIEQRIRSLSASLHIEDSTMDRQADTDAGEFDEDHYREAPEPAPLTPQDEQFMAELVDSELGRLRRDHADELDELWAAGDAAAIASWIGPLEYDPLTGRMAHFQPHQFVDYIAFRIEESRDMDKQAALDDDSCRECGERGSALDAGLCAGCAEDRDAELALGRTASPIAGEDDTYLAADEPAVDLTPGSEKDMADPKNLVRFQNTASAAEDVREERLARLHKAVAGLRLSQASQDLLSEIERGIMDYRDDFIDSAAGLFVHEWDPGSSWEIVEADGGQGRKLVRKESIPEAVTKMKHAHAVGSRLAVWRALEPETVIVRAQEADGRYRVQAEAGGPVFTVTEDDLHAPDMTDGLFD